MKRHLIAATTACLTLFGVPANAAEIDVMILFEGYFPTVTYLNDTDSINFINKSGYYAKVRKCGGSSYLTPWIANGDSLVISVEDLLVATNGKMGFMPAGLSNSGGSSAYPQSDTLWGKLSFDPAPNGPDAPTPRENQISPC